MLTELFKALTKLNTLLRSRKWSKAYTAADELEMQRLK